MIYRFIFFLLTILHSSFEIKCQEVIANDGNYSTTSQGSLSWTIGEMAIETVSNPANILTQGFQQNYEEILFVDELSLLNGMILYPNPFTSALNLSFSNINEDFNLIIIDSQSKVVFQKNVQQATFCQKMSFDLSVLTAGSYFIQIETVNTKQRFFNRIIKL